MCAHGNSDANSGSCDRQVDRSGSTPIYWLNMALAAKPVKASGRRKNLVILQKNLPSMDKKCIVCGKSHTEIPVTRFEYKSAEFFICPQHIPVLIHDPQRLVGLLPDAENFEAG